MMKSTMDKCNFITNIAQKLERDNELVSISAPTFANQSGTLDHPALSIFNFDSALLLLAKHLEHNHQSHVLHPLGLDQLHVLAFDSLLVKLLLFLFDDVPFAHQELLVLVSVHLDVLFGHLHLDGFCVVLKPVLQRVQVLLPVVVCCVHYVPDDE